MSLFVDANGTLINKNSKSIIRKNIIDKIKLFTQDNYFIITSGSTPSEIAKLYEMIPLNDFTRYSIVGGGSGIYDMYNKTTISRFDKKIEKESALLLFDFIEKEKLIVSIFSRKFLYKFSKFTIEDINTIKKINPESYTIITKESLLEISNDLIYKILLICNITNLNKIKLFIETNLPKLKVIVVDALDEKNIALNVIRKDASKSSAMLDLMDMLSLNKNLSSSVGDSFEYDSPMFSVSNYKFAVSNADLELKKIADYVIDNNNYQAVGTIIQNLLGNNNGK